MIPVVLQSERQVGPRILVASNDFIHELGFRGELRLEAERGVVLGGPEISTSRAKATQVRNSHYSLICHGKIARYVKLLLFLFVLCYFFHRICWILNFTPSHLPSRSDLLRHYNR